MVESLDITPKKELSKCCNADTIPPDYEMAKNMGSLYRAYLYHICKKCGKACDIIEK